MYLLSFQFDKSGPLIRLCVVSAEPTEDKVVVKVYGGNGITPVACFLLHVITKETFAGPNGDEAILTHLMIRDRVMPNNRGVTAKVTVHLVPRGEEGSE